MATKTGFQYYSVETDRYQDKKIRRLKNVCGCNGLAVYDFILCEIYRVKGCFLEWDESTAFDVADYFGLKENQVKEIVNYCCAVGLFSKELLTNERILTSSSIQSRFIDWSKKAKRAAPIIPEKILLIPEVGPKITEQQHNILEEIKQSKVKKSKVEENKEKARPLNSGNIPPTLNTGNTAPQTGSAGANGPPFDEVHMFFRGAGGTEEMARKFWNKWEGLQWRYNYQPIVWRPFALNFLNNYEENERRHGKGDSKNGRSAHGQSAGAIKLAQSLADDLGISGAGGASNP